MPRRQLKPRPCPVYPTTEKALGQGGLKIQRTGWMGGCEYPRLNPHKGRCLKCGWTWYEMLCRAVKVAEGELAPN